MGEGSLSASEYDLSVVIPTYNECENVDRLIGSLARVQSRLAGGLEVIIVDDNSPDGTGARAQSLGPIHGVEVNVVTRRGRGGLGSAIAEGIARSRADYVCVMDADLSHPPSMLPTLRAAMDGVDGVVASRYVDGGRAVNWPWRRRAISSVATMMARVLFDPPCRDPLSGFFMVRRACLSGVRITGLGHKPLLEVLTQRRLVLREIPYEFRDRDDGQSKLNVKEIVEYAYYLLMRWKGSLGERPEPQGILEAPILTFPRT